MLLTIVLDPVLPKFDANVQEQLEIPLSHMVSTLDSSQEMMVWALGPWECG